MSVLRGAARRVYNEGEEVEAEESKSLKAAVSCAVLMSIPVIYAWESYALTIMWAWFMVPTFGLARRAHDSNVMPPRARR